ncbi:class I adenylate-forming enzyme family protein [Paraburkholderia fungorum]|uniref:class I adenylate-forming enzyme family protein n=1 Tax=Paraburkholderia fungorum TaxID=134537 RepID=UPI0038B7C1F6
MIQTELIVPVHELLKRHAEERPDKISFEDERSSLTYRQLEEVTARLAVHFQASGVEPGDRVAVLLPNSVEWVVSCLAIVRAGGIAVPVSHEATIPEIEYRLTDASCVAVVTSDSRELEVRKLGDGIPSLKEYVTVQWSSAPVVGTEYRKVVEEWAQGIPVDADTLDLPAFVVYTSGTTGKAKGVLLSTRSMLWVTASCWAPIAGLNQNDRVLSCLPLYHSYAINFAVLSVLAVGASEYLMDRYSSREIPKLLANGDFSVMPGVPTMFHYLLEGAQTSTAKVLPGIRLCVSAGAILPAATNRAFEERFGVKLLDGYGITETSTMVTMNWPTGTRPYGSCGLPLPGVATRIVEPVGMRDVNVGEEGELLVRGPNVMKGYLNKPAETDAALRNGWYHTGDLARFDASGYITITGRLKEVIIRGGQNIAPAEIEQLVSVFDGVLDCAVTGSPHEHLGEVPVVFIVQRDGETVDVEALLARCRTQLSAYKVPHAVHIVAEIPRTGSGKVMRYKLREALEVVAIAPTTQAPG